MIRRHVLQIAIGLVLGALGSSAALGGAVTAHLNNAGSMTEHNVTVVPGETFSVDINVHNSSPIFCLLDLRLQASAGGVLAVVGGDIDGGDVDPLSKPFEWSLPFPQMLPAGDWTLGTVQILVDGQAAPGVYALSAVDGKYMDCRVCPAFGFVRSGPSLTVNVPPMMVLSDPPNCAIDARQPSEPDGSNSAGWQSVSITLSGDATSLTPDDFSVRAYPGPLTTTAIDAVYPTADPRTVQLELSAPMPLGQWTSAWAGYRAMLTATERPCRRTYWRLLTTLTERFNHRTRSGSATLTAARPAARGTSCGLSTCSMAPTSTTSGSAVRCLYAPQNRAGQLFTWGTSRATHPWWPRAGMRHPLPSRFHRAAG